METMNCFITEFYPRGVMHDTQILDHRRTIFFMETILEEQEEEEQQQNDEEEEKRHCF